MGTPRLSTWIFWWFWERIWSLYPKRHHSILESKCQTRELSTHLYRWNWSLSNFFLDALQIPSKWHQFYQITFLSSLLRAAVFLPLASSRYFFLLFFFFNSNHDNNVKEQYTSQNWQESTVNSNTRDTLTTYISEFRLSTMSTSHTSQRTVVSLYYCLFIHYCFPLQPVLHLWNI